MATSTSFPIYTESRRNGFAAAGLAVLAVIYLATSYAPIFQITQDHTSIRNVRFVYNRNYTAIQIGGAVAAVRFILPRAVAVWLNPDGRSEPVEKK